MMISAITIFPIILNLLPIILFVWGIVWVVRYLKRWRQDSQRLRMELGKLAEEVHLMRQEQKGVDTLNVSAHSKSEEDKKGSDK